MPESATAIFESGVRRDSKEDIVMSIQKMIFEYQHNIEQIYKLQFPKTMLLCDRGTLDGLAYWPEK